MCVSHAPHVSGLDGVCVVRGARMTNENIVKRLRGLRSCIVFTQNVTFVFDQQTLKRECKGDPELRVTRTCTVEQVQASAEEGNTA